MGLISRLLYSILSKGFKQRLLNDAMRQMHNDVIRIKAAVYLRIISLAGKPSDDITVTLIAAETNTLFGTVSPQHSKEDLEIGKQLAANLLKNDTEIRYAILMACRAMILLYVNANLLDSKEYQDVFDTIQWMATIWELPPDVATPEKIRDIANTLANKYHE
jgi:hypothetical protein